MKVMVAGGTGAREMDAALAHVVLDRLHKIDVIVVLVAGKDADGNEAAIRWWERRFFVWASSAFVEGPADVVVILPGTTAIQRLREALRQCRSVIVVRSDGHLEVLEGRQALAYFVFRGVA